MLELTFGQPLRRVLCIGAHSDDVEIGCGGTLLLLRDCIAELQVYCLVLSGDATRAAEARHAGSLFGSHSDTYVISTKSFQDGYLPYTSQLKDAFEELKDIGPWDVVFTHSRFDRHQDHRVVSDLTWNTFRDHTILEYEIPKYDGDLGQPNYFVCLAKELCERKVRFLNEAFLSQRDRAWFSRDTFMSMMRIRGIEAASPTGYAEAFFARKLRVSSASLGRDAVRSKTPPRTGISG